MVQQNGEGRAAAVLFVGFDSAWMDNARAPGAICAASFDGQRFPHFEPPQLVGFAKALAFIRSVHRDDRPTLVAMDQPTIVPNASGMRPVDKVTASVSTGLVAEFSLPIAPRPACSATTRQYGASSNAWRRENPELARVAKTGLFLMEVFPVLALPSIADRFYGKGSGHVTIPVAAHGRLARRRRRHNHRGGSPRRRLRGQMACFVGARPRSPPRRIRIGSTR